MEKYIFIEKLKVAAVQGAACGLMIGGALLVHWYYRPPVVPVQAGQAVAETAVTGAPQRLVAANEFQLIDDKGQKRADLFAHRDSMFFTFFDAKGEQRAILFSDAHESSLSIFGVSGTDHAHTVALSASTDGASLSVSDASGRDRAILGSTTLEADKTGEQTILPDSSLVLFDKAGKVSWKAP